MTAENVMVIKTPSTFKVDDTWNDGRFMRIRIAVMHSGENLNHSSFSTKVIKAAKDTFADIPILANIIKYTDENGEEHYDYSGHDAHIEEDAFNEGQYRLIYDEKVVGHVPSQCNFEIVHDDESDRDFAYVDGYLYTEYGNYCCDILESKDYKTDVSAEIYTDSISFDAANNVVVVNEMRMAGITLLGEDVAPAMKGANAQMFSINKEDLQAQMIKVMSELNESLKTYNATVTGENSEKGGNPQLSKFEELLEKYGKTVEEITFEYEGLSDEELVNAFAEAFEESTPEEGEAPAEGGEPETLAEEPEDGEEDDEAEEDNPKEDESEHEDEETDDEQNFAKMSVNIGGEVHEFSVSLQDKISALYTLVNNTYGDEDGTWYDVTVYDDEKYVIMIDYWTGKGYKQSYKVKKDVYTLIGDRVEVFATWLTQDEINKLDKMKTEYSEMSEKLSHYEDEPRKIEILTSGDYSLIADNEEFVKLCEQENHFNMSVEEVTAKADAILTEAAKHQKFSTNNGETPRVTVKPLPAPKKKTKRFGSLFDGIV